MKETLPPADPLPTAIDTAPLDAPTPLLSVTEPPSDVCVLEVAPAVSCTAPPELSPLLPTAREIDPAAEVASPVESRTAPDVTIDSAVTSESAPLSPWPPS